VSTDEDSMIVSVNCQSKMCVWVFDCFASCNKTDIEMKNSNDLVCILFCN
jgi:hypothetical protein